jgi:hypothetical protein
MLRRSRLRPSSFAITESSIITSHTAVLRVIISLTQLCVQMAEAGRPGELTYQLMIVWFQTCFMRRFSLKRKYRYIASQPLR